MGHAGDGSVEPDLEREDTDLMPTWEYMRVQLDENGDPVTEPGISLDQYLEDAGAEGWELVTSFRAGAETHLVFKRPA